jgi:hypothetical protein
MRLYRSTVFSICSYLKVICANYSSDYFRNETKNKVLLNCHLEARIEQFRRGLLGRGRSQNLDPVFRRFNVIFRRLNLCFDDEEESGLG